MHATGSASSECQSLEFNGAIKVLVNSALIGTCEWIERKYIDFNLGSDGGLVVLRSRVNVPRMQSTLSMFAPTYKAV